MNAPSKESREPTEPLQWQEFQRVELRVGTIVGVDDFPEARKPAYQLRVDFGAEVGIKKSSAQIHRPLLQGRFTRSASDGGGQFSAEANRALHVRVLGDRLSP